ncbi:hypothetical protein JKF63_00901 [Porcisia hertigi]|uniref:Uncharacterized protein n=1 Tax=Porcisia hertigi TaxID=2761500 RepID=A0A836HFY6_9TRYP|nr:hypothetical protein JKF63_00901 [Porcisia hertigi]
MTELCSVLLEFPYAEATTASAKRTAVAQQDASQPWATSIVESTTVCTESKVFVIGGFDVSTQRIVSHVRMWDVATRVWTRLPDAPVRVSHASAAAVPAAESIVLFGGWDGEKCSAELWLLHPLQHKGSTPGPDGTSPVGHAGTGKGGASNAPANGRGRSVKGDDDTLYQWNRLEADPLVSPRPAGRYGHALAAGVCEPTSLWHNNLSTPPAAALQQPSGVSSTAVVAAPTLSGVPTPTVMEPVLYVFGGNDTTSWFNDVWRLWLTPSIQRSVAHWEKLKVAPGVNPCPREVAVLAFDATRQCLWLYGGRTATAILDDLWCLSLLCTSGSSSCTWTPVQQLSGQTVAPTRRDLFSRCVPTAAVVDDGSLYVVFSDNPAPVKRLAGDLQIPIYRFCLTTHQQRALSLSEEEVSSRPSTALRSSIRGSQRTQPFHFVASCACSRFLFWLKEYVGAESANPNSRPAVVHVELNVPAARPTKRRSERNR